MNEHKKPMNPELFAQIQKILDPTGNIMKGAPNLEPTPDSRREQHVLHREKKAGLLDSLRSMPEHVKQLGANPESRKALQEVGGLGVLAVPALDEGQAWARARLAGDKTSEGVEKRQVLPDAAHSAAELAGLGILAHPELHHLKMPKMASVLDELEKIGFVSESEAERALASIQSLEQDKPTKRQTAGYVAAGSAIAPVFHVAANAIAKRPLLAGDTHMDKFRDAAGQALKGGVGGTAAAMAQRHIDRKDKTDTLKAYLAQHQPQTQDPDLQKSAGFLDAAKNLLTTPIAGTPTLLAGRMPSSPKPLGSGASEGFKKFQAQQAQQRNKTAGAPRLVGPKMPGLAGSGTPAMPMPSPKPALAVV